MNSHLGDVFIGNSVSTAVQVHEAVRPNWNIVGNGSMYRERWRNSCKNSSNPIKEKKRVVPPNLRHSTILRNSTRKERRDRDENPAQRQMNRAMTDE